MGSVEFGGVKGFVRGGDVLPDDLDDLSPHLLGSCSRLLAVLEVPVLLLSEGERSIGLQARRGQPDDAEELDGRKDEGGEGWGGVVDDDLGGGRDVRDPSRGLESGRK